MGIKQQAYIKKENTKMPLIDMSVEELFKYKGSSPCPEDIDKYWDDALAEMNSLNHYAQFIKKEYPSRTADM